MHNSSWILLDTETNGIKTPIYAVELAAQRMRGWEPEGPSFQRMLNHGVEIPPEASRVNGYTREILERDGEDPLQVYGAFAEYVDDWPLVAYNLPYDLDQVLIPEWKRLRVQPIGVHGFCALKLAQRLLDPVPAGNHKLQTLRQFYRLPQRGAHTALGDVETVADLMQDVLRPIAEQRGLVTWDAVVSFTKNTWFPSRIAFGKHKGKHYRDALEDQDLYQWLEWLAGASNKRSADMGNWYLEQLRLAQESPDPGPAMVEVVLSDSSELMLYNDPELETLLQLVASARSRLANLESDYTQELHAVNVVRAQLFTILRSSYERRDALLLKVEYRRKYLDALMIEGKEEAEAVAKEHEQSQEETEQAYEEAAAEAEHTKELSEDEQKELKTIHRQLARLYHPDRYAHDPEKQDVFERLMQAVNDARDRGDIVQLREIADDPNGFLARNGLLSLDLEDDEELTKLRQLYNSLQTRILGVYDLLEQLRDSEDYEVYKLSLEKPEFVQELATEQAEVLTAEITELKEEAERLANEIRDLTGTDPF